MPAPQGTSNHPVGEVRHGQLITTYGPGAMVDLPDRSVVIGGLNLWHYSRDDDSSFIDQPRLIAKLRGLLGLGTLLLKRHPVKTTISLRNLGAAAASARRSSRSGSWPSPGRIPSRPSLMTAASATAPGR